MIDIVPEGVSSTNAEIGSLVFGKSTKNIDPRPTRKVDEVRRGKIKNSKMKKTKTRFS